MPIELPKVDKKGYTFRLSNPMMRKFYSYCEQENTTPSLMINKLINDELKNKTTIREEYRSYYSVLIPTDGLIQKEITENKSNISKSNILTDTEIGTYRLNLKKHIKETGLLDLAILIHPNNYLDKWMDQTFRSEDNPNTHTGLNVIEYKNTTYYIKHRITDDDTVSATLLTYKEALKEVEDANNSLLYEKLTKTHETDEYIIVDDDKEVEDILNENLEENNTPLANNVLESENIKLRKEVEELKHIVETNNKLMEEKIKLLDKLNLEELEKLLD